MIMISAINHLYHWKIYEHIGGEIWLRGLRINGKFLSALIFEADLTGMEFDTSSGLLKLEMPEEKFRRNTENIYGSIENYLRSMPNLICRGRIPFFNAEKIREITQTGQYHVREMQEKIAISMPDGIIGSQSMEIHP